MSTAVASTRYEIELTANAPATPKAAMKSAARVGPTARATL
jgi:hypothetical protein